MSTDEDLLGELDMVLIGVDRPGYGGSDRHPNRSELSLSPILKLSSSCDLPFTRQCQASETDCPEDGESAAWHGQHQMPSHLWPHACLMEGI